MGEGEPEQEGEDPPPVEGEEVREMLNPMLRSELTKQGILSTPLRPPFPLAFLHAFPLAFPSSTFLVLVFSLRDRIYHDHNLPLTAHPTLVS